MENLTASEYAVLDQLLSAYPLYDMVDDYATVQRLIGRDLVEPNVRLDGDCDQAVYRITEKGAAAYGSVGTTPPLERVS